jgi:hypothetical protein
MYQNCGFSYTVTRGKPVILNTIETKILNQPSKLLHLVEE